jgi:DNA-binding response OmpR family regulator
MAGEHILVVDDEPEISQLVRLYLEREGFKVSCATDGSSALDMVKTGEIDCIILDVLLPDLDGIEACTEMRRFTDVPILFLSCKDKT